MLDLLGLRNFKAFQDIQIPLGNLTLLTGLNGAGKSTIIQALGLIRQSWDASALTRHKADGFVDLNGPYVQIGTGRDALCEHFEPDLDGSTSIGFYFRFSDREAEVNCDYEAFSDSLKARTSGDFDELPLLNYQYHHVRADRIGPSEYYLHSHDETVRRRLLGAKGEFAVDRLFSDAEKVVPENRRCDGRSGATLREQVDAWIGRTCPGVSLDAQRVSNTDLVRLEVGFGSRSGLNSTNRYRPTNVGFGVTYVLPIVIACLTAPAGSLISLENPEAHLHPRGQAEMARLCAKVALDGVQVIVESHSDHFMNGLRLEVKRSKVENWANIAYFDPRIADGFASIDIDDFGSLSDWPVGFFDESHALLSRLVAP